MGSFLYYLFCCGCCGLCCRPKYVKKNNMKEKAKTIKQLEEVSKGLTFKTTTATNPTSMKTREMTDFYIIPDNNFKSVKDLMDYLGFTQGQQLGYGAQGQVFKGKHNPSGMPMAIKVCRLPEDYDDRSHRKRRRAIKAAKSELFILETLRHPHLIQLMSHFIVVEHQEFSLHIVMKFAEKGDLLSFLRREGPFDEKLSKVWFSQMLSALIYMHSKGIAHRDLKLQNILIDINDDVLISDFGLSKVVSPEALGDNPLESTTYCGTPPYMAPEVLEKKTNKRLVKVPYDPFLADVWSLGVVLYYLLNSCAPFEVNSERKRAKAIELMKQKKWSFSDNMLEPPTAPLKEIMSKMFEPNVKQRPKMLDLSTHLWVSKMYKTVDKKYKKWIKTNLKNN